MSRPDISKLINSDRKVLLLIFVCFTLIASVQFLQYFIAYNSSYPFPWKYNLSITFGTFYTYFVFVPLIFRWNARFQQKSFNKPAFWVLHMAGVLTVSCAHLLLVQLLEWVQVYRFAEASFFQSYRWKLARWLHLELLMYFVITGVWYFVRLQKWKHDKKGETTGELEKSINILKRIKTKVGSDIGFVDISKVRWIEAYDNYVKCFVDGRYILVRTTLSGLEKGLDPSVFQRIHRSCIVAVREVEKIRHQGGAYQVVLKDDTVLKLSRTYKEALEQRLTEGQ